MRRAARRFSQHVVRELQAVTTLDLQRVTPVVADQTFAQIAPHAFLHEPLIDIRRLDMLWLPSGQQCLEWRQDSGHPAPQPRQHQIGMTPPVTHDMEEAPGRQPHLHRAHFAQADDAVAVANHEVAHRRVIGDREAPTQPLSQGVTGGTLDQLGVQFPRQGQEVVGHAVIVIEPNPPPRIQHRRQQQVMQHAVQVARPLAPEAEGQHARLAGGDCRGGFSGQPPALRQRQASMLLVLERQGATAMLACLVMALESGRAAGQRVEQHRIETAPCGQCLTGRQRAGGIIGARQTHHLIERDLFIGRTLHMPLSQNLAGRAIIREQKQVIGDLLEEARLTWTRALVEVIDQLLQRLVALTGAPGGMRRCEPV